MGLFKVQTGLMIAAERLMLVLMGSCGKSAEEAPARRVEFL